MKTIRDVLAEIPGSSEPDEWVIRGNHYDAWVNGAQDPVSGVSAELEEAHALGELRKAGWKPKRTIIYAAWDGEEPGLLGSTEWVEEHAEELRAHAAVYINSDNNSRGYAEVEWIRHDGDIRQSSGARHHRSGREDVGVAAQAVEASKCGGVRRRTGAAE